MNKIVIDDTIYETNLTKKFNLRKKYVPKNPNQITAFIPGVITDILVGNGQTVRKGEPLLILEAMKMKNELKSNINGKIKNIYIKTNQSVTKGELLLEFE